LFQEINMFATDLHGSTRILKTKADRYNDTLFANLIFSFLSARIR
jgi:hypothetical protein